MAPRQEVVVSLGSSCGGRGWEPGTYEIVAFAPDSTVSFPSEVESGLLGADGCYGPTRLATVAYKPTAAQRRVVIARYQQCSFPGCGGRAHHADLDHAVPFDDGGETTVANLHPLCRHHHQVKQRGWSVTRTPDGSSQWTSPTGKHYRSTPGEQ